jgi:hypothetical protein
LCHGKWEASSIVNRASASADVTGFPRPEWLRLTGLDFLAGHHDARHERDRDREDHDGRGEAYLDGNIALAVGSLQYLAGRFGVVATLRA